MCLVWRLIHGRYSVYINSLPFPSLLISIPHDICYCSVALTPTNFENRSEKFPLIHPTDFVEHMICVCPCTAHCAPWMVPSWVRREIHPVYAHPGFGQNIHGWCMNRVGWKLSGWSDCPGLWRLGVGPVKGMSLKVSKGSEGRHFNLRNGVSIVQGSRALSGSRNQSQCWWDTALQELGETQLERKTGGLHRRLPPGPRRGVVFCQSVESL